MKKILSNVVDIIKINKKTLLKTFIIELMFLLGLIFIIPYIASVLKVYLGGAVQPNIKNVLLYVIIYYPMYIGYLIYLFKRRKSVKFLKFIFYPLSVFNILLGLLACLIALNGAVVWFFAICSPVILAVIILSFILGLIADIRTLLKQP